VERILETHVHADHLTAAKYIQKRVGGRLGIGQQVSDVREVFQPVFDLSDSELVHELNQWDDTFSDGTEFSLGNIKCRVMSTPGHTPACVTYQIGNAIFCGDTCK
jgi:glyoxylase-like metal-dependent hydrolase (beta-lactamase superfamily II)